MCKQLARSRSVWAGALIVSVISAVSGCGLVDTVGPRGVHYNDEFADSKSGIILLNIIRAAYSMPLQFTDLSTFTASATAGGALAGSTGASIPVPLNNLARLLPRTATVSPSISLNGSLNASTSTGGVNLNTQEFYQGLQKPLTEQQIHFYLTKSVTSLADWQLLTLFVSDIVVIGQRASGEAYSKRLYGRADTLDNFRAFAASIYRLVDLGLTIQPVPQDKTKVGPELTAYQASDPWLLAALVKASTAEKTGLTLDTLREKGKETGKFQLRASAAEEFQFCFSPITESHRTLSTEFRKYVLEPIEIGLFPTAMGDLIPRLKITNACGFARPEEQQDIRFATRSLAGIFYFLGEMVRTELGIGIDGTPTSLDMEGYRLFSVKQRRPSKGEIGVKYDGQWFSVEVDPTGRYDSSSRVLQILADLLALQSEAKDFPASNVVTIANP